MNATAEPSPRGRRWLPLDFIDWVRLARIRGSVLSRAISVLSITSLFLTNLAPALRDHGISVASFERLFVGSLLFLGGSLIFALRAPPQLAAGGEIYEIVSRMRTLTDWDFFSGMRTQATQALARASKKYIPSACATLLTSRVETAKGLQPTCTDWVDRTAGLYQAHLEVLKYDRPLSRIAAALAMFVGALLLFWPVLRNVALAMWGLLCNSLGFTA